MSRTKKGRKLRGGRKLRRIGAGIVSAVTVIAMAFVLLPQESVQVLAAETAADNNTTKDYMQSLGENASTRYAGRVWTDKTVYTEDAVFTGDVGSVTVEKGDADFLVSYSALSTSMEISGSAVAPLDVVFVIDDSSSMVNSGYLDDTVTAVNQSLASLMEMNENNRAAVILYDTDSASLLPLGHYTSSENGTFINYTGSGRYFYNTVEQDVAYNNPSSDRWGVDTDECLDMGSSRGTNIQMGVYTGMNILAENQDTTVQVDGTTVNRVPAVIVLSDGSPTYSSSSRSWWSPSNDNRQGPGSSTYYGNGMLAMATASYMKQQITDNYAQGNAESPYAARVYTVGMGITSLDNEEWSWGQSYYTGERDLANLTLDPSGQGNWNNEIAEQVKTAFEQYTQGNNVEIEVDSGGWGSSGTYTMRHPESGDITSLTYNDGYYDAAAAGDVVGVFEDIISEISISTPQVPTEVTGSDPTTDGYITYTDPIGEYMEVSDVKEIIFGGTEFTKKETSAAGQKVTYTFEGEINSEVYGKHNLSEIQITVEQTDDTHQILTVKIPASVIPLRVNTIALDADGNVKSNTNNQAYPIRILYTIHAQEGVDLETLEGVSEEYIAEHTGTDGKVNFYSNVYTGNTQGDTSVGDAKVEFTPAKTNPFYFVQENIPLYTDEGCREPAVQYDKGATYYFQIYYYDGNAKRTAVVSRSADLMEGYTEVIQGQLNLKEGSPRLGNLQDFTQHKEGNTTDTAAAYYYPTFTGDLDTGHFTVYLGNNGVLKAEAPSSLTIEKEVTAEEGLTAPDKAFSFQVTIPSKAETTIQAVLHTEGSSDSTVELKFGGDGVAEFELKDGQSLEIPHIGNGTEYKVEEKNIPQGFAFVQTETTVGEQEAVIGDSNPAEGTMTTADAHVVFHNRYSTEPLTIDADVTLGLAGTKILSGREFKETDSFTFKLRASQVTPNAPLPEETEVTIEPDNGDTADFTFGEKSDITFTKPGEYRYIIQEVNPNVAEGGQGLPGVTYDATLYRLIVTVKDEGNGTLSETHTLEKQIAGSDTWQPVSAGELDFTNTYNAEAVTASLRGTKELNGKELVDSAYTFIFSAGGSRAIGSEDAYQEDSTQPMPVNTEISNIAAGDIVFDGITFTQESIGKQYLYYVTEKQPTENGLYDGTPLEGAVKNETGQWVYEGVTYDHSVKEITAAVSSELVEETETVRVTTSGEEFVFTNTYKAIGTLDLTGTKTIDGRSFQSRDTFTFTVENTEKPQEVEKAPMPESSEVTVTPTSGNSVAVEFGTIEFTEEGTYRYQITETKGSLGGMTYDTEAKLVTVTVTDNGDGTMHVDTSYSTGESLIWENTYKAVFNTDTAVNLNGTKNLSGQSLEESEFFFTVEAVNDAPMGESLGTNSNEAGTDEDGDGTYTGDIRLLKNITYTEAGEYYYLIREQIPEVPRTGMTYDETIYQITVKVTDDLQGTLTAEEPIIEKGIMSDGIFTKTEDAQSIVFNNQYAPLTVNVTPLTLTKVLDGDRAEGLKEGEFSFELSLVSANPEDGIILPSETIITNSADGTVQFGDITFTKPGTYVVKAAELKPQDGKVPGVEYDSHEITTTFTVRDIDGQLRYSRNTQGSQTFTNTYKAEGSLEGSTTLQVEKILSGREWQEGDSFTFLLTGDETTEQAVQDGFITMPDREIIIENTSEHKTAAFGNITFSKPGDYIFYISEKAGGIGGITYSKAQYTISVHVEDNADGTMTVVSSMVQTTNDAGETGSIPAADNTAVFTNTYIAGEIVVDDTDLQFTKVFTGKDWNKENFEFTLTPTGGKDDEGIEITPQDVPMPDITKVSVDTPDTTGGNSATFGFGPITYTQAGVYYYDVTETNGGTTQNGITYDGRTAKITVTVTDDLNGSLVAHIEKENDTFRNSYSTEVDYDAKGGLSVVKNLTGHAMAQGQFTFHITPADEASAEKAGIDPSGKEFTNAAAGMENGISTDTMIPLTGLTFTQEDSEKTYTYEIRETGEQAEGYTNDSTVYTVEISVSDDGDGVMTVTTTVTPSDGEAQTFVYKNTEETQAPVELTFDNLYEAKGTLGGDGEVSLEAAKILNGQNLDEGMFTFLVKDKNENTVTTGTNMAAADGEQGKIVFDPVTFTTEGLEQAVQDGIAEYKEKDGNRMYIFQYTVSEDVSSLPEGVTANAEHFAITVTVEDKGNGSLAIAVTYPDEGLTFINTYGKDETAQILINGFKEYEVQSGDNAPDITGAYTFTLSGNNGAKLPEKITAQNDKAGNISFGMITYTMEDMIGAEENPDGSRTKEFIYTVTEEGEVQGVANDPETEKTFTVTVTDDGNGHLSVLSNPVGIQFTFTNCYFVTPTDPSSPTDGSITLTKELTGRKLNADEFTFVMVDKNGNIVSQGTNTEDGNVILSGITFESQGTYTYELREEIGTLGGVSYDSRIYKAFAYVTDTGIGTLDVQWSITDSEGNPVDKIAFCNTYKTEGTASVQIGASKRLDGRALKEGEFTFCLKNEDGETVAEAINDETGRIRFETLSFDKAGTYVYTVSEMAGADETILYDDTTYEVTVTVEDDLQGHLKASVDTAGKELVFTNVYKEPIKEKGSSAPGTGDDSAVRPVLLTAVVALVILAAAVVLILRRRR